PPARRTAPSRSRRRCSAWPGRWRSSTPRTSSWRHRSRGGRRRSGNVMRTDGHKVIDFAEHYLVLGTGDYLGRTVALRDLQKRIINELYEVDGSGNRRYSDALIGLPKGSAKSSLVAMVALYELFAT